jgi:hypothetical protein
LRFQPPHATTARAILPPLFPPSTNRADSASATNSPVAPINLASTNRPSGPTATVSIEAASTPMPDAAALLAIPVNGDQDAGLNPQIDSHKILEYLAPQSTNTHRGDAHLWPTFIPPVTPLPSKSSQATYESR